VLRFRIHIIGHGFEVVACLMWADDVLSKFLEILCLSTSVINPHISLLCFLLYFKVASKVYFVKKFYLTCLYYKHDIH